MPHSRLSKYEKLLIDIAMNAGEKIIDAATLLKTKYSYRDSMLLLIVAQEEMSKFVILPFAKAADKIDDVINEDTHRGIYFNHRYKQKVFTSFGAQNRSYAELERIKQGCLYIGATREGNPSRYVAKEKDTRKELCMAARLYVQLVEHNVHLSPDTQVSLEAKRLISWFSSTVFIPALKDLTPEIIEDLQKYVLDKSARSSRALKALKNKKADDKDLHELLMTNPFIFVDMVSHAKQPEEVKEYFSKVITDKKGIATDRLLKHLEIK